jgi:hypothetical protein
MDRAFLPSGHDEALVRVTVDDQGDAAFSSDLEEGAAVSQAVIDPIGPPPGAPVSAVGGKDLHSAGEARVPEDVLQKAALRRADAPRRIVEEIGACVPEREEDHMFPEEADERIRVKVAELRGKVLRPEIRARPGSERFLVELEPGRGPDIDVVVPGNPRHLGPIEERREESPGRFEFAGQAQRREVPSGDHVIRSHLIDVLDERPEDALAVREMVSPAQEGEVDPPQDALGQEVPQGDLG